MPRLYLGLEALLIHPFPNDLTADVLSFKFRWQFGYVHGTQWWVGLQEVSIIS